MLTPYILDLIVLGIIVICAIVSAIHGFTRTILEVVGFAAALILAYTVSAPLAELAYDNVIEPSVITTVEKAAEDGTENIVDTTWNALPKLIRNQSEKFNLSKERLSEKISANASKTSSAAAVTASETVVRPITVGILSLIFKILIALILLFLVRWLAKLINDLISFTPMKKLNSTLGALLGIVKGAAISAVFCIVVQLIITITKNGFLCFTQESVNQSIVFRLFSEWVPFIHS